MGWFDGLRADLCLDVLNAGRRVVFIGHSVYLLVGQLFVGLLAGVYPECVDGSIGRP